MGGDVAVFHSAGRTAIDFCRVGGFKLFQAYGAGAFVDGKSFLLPFVKSSNGTFFAAINVSCTLGRKFFAAKITFHFIPSMSYHGCSSQTFSCPLKSNCFCNSANCCFLNSSSTFSAASMSYSSCWLANSVVFWEETGAGLSGISCTSSSNKA